MGRDGSGSLGGLPRTRIWEAHDQSPLAGGFQDPSVRLRDEELLTRRRQRTPVHHLTVLLGQELRRPLVAQLRVRREQGDHFAEHRLEVLDRQIALLFGDALAQRLLGAVAPVCRRESQTLDREKVLLCGVALVLREPVAGVLGIEFGQRPIAVGFGEDCRS